jgi:dTDP-4-dehydrorhamnose reductase
MHDGHNGGIYHFTGQPDTSWAGFAREIFDQAGMVVEVSGIPTTDYPTPAQRPLNSRLDCESLFNDFSIARPDWRQGLSDVLKELAKT